MAIARNVRVSPEDVDVLVRRILPLFRHERIHDCEVALLVAYCNIAEGVRNFPEASRQHRAGLVVSEASRAICEAIERVGAMSDAELLLHGPMGRACQE